MKKNMLFILPGFTVLVLSLANACAATLFPVVIGDHWGFADKSGKLVINPQFERAEPFASGLAEVRLARGAALLRQAAFVKEAAAEAGFNSPAHFTRRFTQRYGVPPSAFRLADVARSTKCPIRACNVRLGQVNLH